MEVSIDLLNLPDGLLDILKKEYNINTTYDIECMASGRPIALFDACRKFGIKAHELLSKNLELKDMHEANRLYGRPISNLITPWKKVFEPTFNPNSRQATPEERERVKPKDPKQRKNFKK